MRTMNQRLDEMNDDLASTMSNEDIVNKYGGSSESRRALLVKIMELENRSK